MANIPTQQTITAKLQLRLFNVSISNWVPTRRPSHQPILHLLKLGTIRLTVATRSLSNSNSCLNIQHGSTYKTYIPLYIYTYAYQTTNNHISYSIYIYLWPDRSSDFHCVLYLISNFNSTITFFLSCPSIWLLRLATQRHWCFSCNWWLSFSSLWLLLLLWLHPIRRRLPLPQWTQVPAILHRFPPL